MEDKARYVLYVIILGLVLGGLGTILSGALSAPGTRVHIATFFLVCICVFLVLFNYQPAKTVREIELALLKRVRDAWVTDLANFEKGLPQGSLFPLGFSFSSDHVRTPARLTPLKTSVENSIYAAFEITGGSLLIIGESGSGKTVSLLQLTRSLVEDAEKNPAAPLPVLLSLATWKKPPMQKEPDLLQPSFDSWLVKTLRERYDVSDEVARHWILGNRLLFLLDDLNPEAEGCVPAINAFLESAGIQRIVIATQDAPLECKLNLNGAIRLNQLSEGDVRRVLSQAGKDLTPNWIAEIARSPLMLRVILATPDTVLNKIQIVSYDDNDRDGIVGTYVDYQVKSALRINPPYSRPRLNDWLSWLARTSKHVSQPVFAVEELQPDWLEQKQQRNYVYLSRVLGAIVIMLLGVGLMFLSEAMGRLVGSYSFTLRFIKVSDRLLEWVLITGIFGGFLIGVLDYLRLRQWPEKSLKAWIAERLRAKPLWANLLSCFTIFLGLGLAFGIDRQSALRGAAAFAVAFAFSYWNRDRERSMATDITTAHKLVWAAADFPRGLYLGLLGGYVSGLVYLTFKLAEYSVPFSSNEYVIHIFSVLAFLVGFGRRLRRAQSGEAKDSAKLLNNSPLERGTLFAACVGIATTVIVWLGFGLTYAPRILLLSCLLGVLIGGIVKGLKKVSIVESRTPHQGLKTSLRTTILLWLSVGVPTVALLWGYSVRVIGQEGTFKESLFFGMMLGLLFGFSYGGLDLIYRFVLRLILWRRGALPAVDYVRVLDDAANLGLLRKVGHAYVFYHDRIRDSIARIA